MPSFQVLQLRVGRARPFGPKGQPSAIDKTVVMGPVHASATGLVGDEQANRRHHGGPDKALHAYAIAHYTTWASELPDRTDRFVPGAFGENLVVDGVTEAHICLGDQWRVGEAVLQVSQGRQPCWKLNVRFDTKDMSRRVQRSGRTGWYFRVLEPGPIAPGAASLVARPNPDWPLDRVTRLLYRDVLDLPALTELAALLDLPDRWRKLALRRVQSGQVEDWERRLTTPE